MKTVKTTTVQSTATGATSQPTTTTTTGRTVAGFCCLLRGPHILQRMLVIYRANYASAALAVVILSVRPSVRLSVGMSVSRVLCDEMMMKLPILPCAEKPES